MDGWIPLDVTLPKRQFVYLTAGDTAALCLLVKFTEISLIDVKRCGISS
jgi:hypothetical protein